MAKGQRPAASDMEKILEKLTNLDKKLDDIKSEITVMKKDLTLVQQVAEDNTKRMGGLEGDVRAIQRREEARGNVNLTLQMEKMSYFLRFQNVEELDQEDLRETMIKLLGEFIGREVDFMRWDIDLVYRLNSQYALVNNVPREVHVKFVRRETRDEILRKQRAGELTHRGKVVTILKQIPRQVRELRRNYYFLSNKLYLKGIGFRWLTPEGMLIFGEGTRKKINTVAEAKAYMEEHKALLEGEDTGTEEGEVLEVQGEGAGQAAVPRVEGGAKAKLRPRKK